MPTGGPTRSFLFESQVSAGFAIYATIEDFRAQKAFGFDLANAITFSLAAVFSMTGALGFSLDGEMTTYFTIDLIPFFGELFAIAGFVVTMVEVVITLSKDPKPTCVL